MKFKSHAQRKAVMANMPDFSDRAIKSRELQEVRLIKERESQRDKSNVDYLRKYDSYLQTRTNLQGKTFDVSLKNEITLKTFLQDNPETSRKELIFNLDRARDKPSIIDKALN